MIVNVENFARAETAAQFDGVVANAGGVNRFFHLRGPTPLDQQTVIRMNRDTLYSAAVVDISNGATLTVPDAGDRYMSIMVVNEDHYLNKVIHEPGEHELTVEEFGTPYVVLAVRTLVDESDPRTSGAGPVEARSGVREGLHPPGLRPGKLQDHLRGPACTESRQYRRRVPPLGARRMSIRFATCSHRLGAGGGLPEEEASYLNVEPNLPVGAYAITVRDVPVDAFWSVTVYNKDGFIDPNDQDAYSVNSLIGTPNEDGSYTIHFGGSPAA